MATEELIKRLGSDQQVANKEFKDIIDYLIDDGKSIWASQSNTGAYYIIVGLINEALRQAGASSYLANYRKQKKFTDFRSWIENSLRKKSDMPLYQKKFVRRILAYLHVIFNSLKKDDLFKYLEIFNHEDISQNLKTLENLIDYLEFVLQHLGESVQIPRGSADIVARAVDVVYDAANSYEHGDRKPQEPQATPKKLPPTTGEPKYTSPQLHIDRPEKKTSEEMDPGKKMSIKERAAIVQQVLGGKTKTLTPIKKPAPATRHSPVKINPPVATPVETMGGGTDVTLEDVKSKERLAEIDGVLSKLKSELKALEDMKSKVDETKNAKLIEKWKSTYAEITRQREAAESEQARIHLTDALQHYTNVTPGLPPSATSLVAPERTGTEPYPALRPTIQPTSAAGSVTPFHLPDAKYLGNTSAPIPAPPSTTPPKVTRRAKPLPTPPENAEFDGVIPEAPPTTPGAVSSKHLKRKGESTGKKERKDKEPKTGEIKASPLSKRGGAEAGNELAKALHAAFAKRREKSAAKGSLDDRLSIAADPRNYERPKEKIPITSGSSGCGSSTVSTSATSMPDIKYISPKPTKKGPPPLRPEHLKLIREVKKNAGLTPPTPAREKKPYEPIQPKQLSYGTTGGPPPLPADYKRRKKESKKPPPPPSWFKTRSEELKERKSGPTPKKSPLKQFVDNISTNEMKAELRGAEMDREEWEAKQNDDDIEKWNQQMLTMQTVYRDAVASGMDPTTAMKTLRDGIKSLPLVYQREIMVNMMNPQAAPPDGDFLTPFQALGHAYGRALNAPGINRQDQKDAITTIFGRLRTEWDDKSGVKDRKLLPNEKNRNFVVPRGKASNKEGKKDTHWAEYALALAGGLAGAYLAGPVVGGEVAEWELVGAEAYEEEGALATVEKTGGESLTTLNTESKIAEKIADPGYWAKWKDKFPELPWNKPNPEKAPLVPKGGPPGAPIGPGRPSGPPPPPPPPGRPILNPAATSNTQTPINLIHHPLTDVAQGMAQSAFTSYGGSKVGQLYDDYMDATRLPRQGPRPIPNIPQPVLPGARTPQSGPPSTGSEIVDPRLFDGLDDSQISDLEDHVGQLDLGEDYDARLREYQQDGDRGKWGRYLYDILSAAGIVTATTLWLTGGGTSTDIVPQNPAEPQPPIAPPANDDDDEKPPPEDKPEKPPRSTTREAQRWKPTAVDAQYLNKDDPTLRLEFYEGGADMVDEVNKDVKLREIDMLQWTTFKNYNWELNHQSDNPLYEHELAESVTRFSSPLIGEEVMPTQNAEATDIVMDADVEMRQFKVGQAISAEAAEVMIPVVPLEGQAASSDHDSEMYKSRRTTEMEFHNVDIPDWFSIPDSAPIEQFTAADGTQYPDSERTRPGTISSYWWEKDEDINQFIFQTLN